MSDRRELDTYGIIVTVSSADLLNDANWECDIPVAKYNRFWLDLDELIKRYSANPL